ncbi:MAG: TraR/DksA C4-type zinc finger protein [Arcobacteraceae bacterium]|nr:TraR/DksA C4-type zinc finger protein [Arcobacteraceae bacterium]
MNIDDIKKAIFTEIAKTEKSIVDLAEQNKPIEPDVSLGRLTRMDAINTKGVIEASLKQAQLRLNSLNNALTKVGSDEFGICIGCGEQIPIGRILIRPESVYCVKCAS